MAEGELALKQLAHGCTYTLGKTLTGTTAIGAKYLAEGYNGKNPGDTEARTHNLWIASRTR